MSKTKTPGYAGGSEKFLDKEITPLEWQMFKPSNNRSDFYRYEPSTPKMDV